MTETKYGHTESEFAHILSKSLLVGVDVKSAAMWEFRKMEGRVG
jgi:hypothetical protein